MNILITGTSSGIGEAIALFYSTDKNVTVTGIERKERDVSWKILPHDLASIGTISGIFPLKEKYDAIILNAGVGYFDNFEDMSSSQCIEMIHVNLLANIELLRLLKSHDNIAPGAKIVTIGSQASKHFFSGGAVYQASKWGLRGFIGSLRKEWKQVQLYLIHPQIVETRFFRNTHNGSIPPSLPRTKKEDIVRIIDSILHSQGNYGWEIDC